MIEQLWLRLIRRLYPTGRVFKVPANSNIERIHKAINLTFIDAFNAGYTGILDTILPDNDNFTEEDAAVWEIRLRITPSSSSTLGERKNAISRKYGQPGELRARSSRGRMQDAINKAGFNVLVTENLAGIDPADFFPINRIPIQYGNTEFLYGSEGAVYGALNQEEIISPSLVEAQYGQFQYGQFQYGGLNTEVIANHIRSTQDANFSIIDNRQFFFLSGTVGLDRLTEFRELILIQKPLQMIGLFFNELSS